MSHITTYGYMGKICVVDLDSGNIRDEVLDDRIYREYIGGEGLGAFILYNRQKAGVDALGPENILGVFSGLLTGCGVPSSARTTVVTKSPLTDTWGDSNVGGFFGPELKSCGYDGIIFTGASTKPVYLLITDEKTELRDASHLWGKDIVETTQSIQGELGGRKIRMASIGPSGEVVSLISSIIADGRAAARSGVGAVMGSKRLKSIVLSGRKKVQTADPESIKKMRNDFIRFLKETDYFVIKRMREAGSCGLVSIGIVTGIAPIKNWSESGEKEFPRHAEHDGDSVLRYQTARHGCAGCTIACGGTLKVQDGPYKGVETRKPEYETLVAFGSLCLNEDLESIFKAQDICDRYALDTISAGNAVAFAIECFENDIITEKETGGLRLSWGNAPAIITLLEQLAKREGFGAILSDGVKKAAEKIGRGSEKYAMHIKGQELPFHDFRYEPPGRGVAYISDPTPARHERYSGMQLLERGNAIGPYPELQAHPIDENDEDGRGKAYAIGNKYWAFFSACGLCAYIMGASNRLPLVDFVSAATGWNFTATELLTVGERIQTLRHLFNLREGVNLKDFQLPERLKSPPSFQGPMKGTDFNFDYNALARAYFKAMAWDEETGQPSKERLKELGIEE